jgi:hypothetical protein
MPGRSLRTCSAVASTRTQPAVLVAVAFVAQTPACGIGFLCPDLIHQPLHGGLRLQLPDRQWVPCRRVNGLTVKHQRVARVLTVVRDDPLVTHEERSALRRVASPVQKSGDEDLEMDPRRADSIRRVRASIVVPSSRARLGLRSTKV